MSNTAIAVPAGDYRGLTLVVSAAEAVARHQELLAFVTAAMVPGVDYGSIPGVQKRILMQPGAQKLAELYGLAQDFVDVEVVQDWDRPFFLYRKKCVLTMRRDTRFIGSGIGSCNSKEDRYAWRWVKEEDVPNGMQKAELHTRLKTYNNRPNKQFRVPNEDIYSLVNTIEKMAAKRALIHAVVGATRSAGIFTQDADTINVPEAAFGVPNDRRSWELDDDSAGRGESSDVSEAQRQEAQRLAKAIADAPDVATLKPLAKEADRAVREGRLTVEQFEALTEPFNSKMRAFKERRGAQPAAAGPDEGP